MVKFSLESKIQHKHQQCDEMLSVKFSDDTYQSLSNDTIITSKGNGVH